MRRVVVTGMGMVAGTGLGVPAFWDAVRIGRPAFGPLEATPDRRLGIRMGAVVRNFPSTGQLDRRQRGQLDRFAQLALVAAREAVSNAGVEWSDALREAAGVVTGSTIGGQETQDESFQRIYGQGGSRVNPLTIPKVMPSAGAVAISMEFGLTGPSFTLSTACASSAHAIGQAFWMVRHSTLDLAVAGGSEAPFNFGNLMAWDALQIVDPEPCRPFSRDRQGLNLGEAGAMLVLEPLDAALARGATIHAEIVGFGMSADAHHLTHPHIDGPVKAMRNALADAKLNLSEVDYINAHGTGTLANDAMECRAIRSLFGPCADRLAVSSTKAVHGHTLGAAGAVETVATVLALRHGIIPPTASFTEADPDNDLDIVQNLPRQSDLRVALNNSFAFGGLNAVLALIRYDGK